MQSARKTAKHSPERVCPAGGSGSSDKKQVPIDATCLEETVRQPKLFLHDAEAAVTSLIDKIGGPEVVIRSAHENYWHVVWKFIIQAQVAL